MIMLKRLILLVMTLATVTLTSAQDAKQLYQEGKALYDAQKYDQAFPKLLKSAEKGNKKAQYRVGRCYDKGRGVAKDKKTAFKWYQKSADQDYAKAQLAVGKAYMKGTKGVTADPKKARTWLRKAVKNPKDGAEVLQKLKDEAAAGDEDAKQILEIIK